MCLFHSSVDVTLSPKFLSVVFKSSCDLLGTSLPLILWKHGSQKANGAPKSKVKGEVHNLSEQVKIWDVLKVGMPLVEIGW
jgi:hypothetical protein